MNKQLPKLAITMGDPAGVGPEIILKALSHADVFEKCHPVVIGDERILTRASAWLDLPPLQCHRIDTIDEATWGTGAIHLLDLHNADPEQCPPGKVSASAGRAAAEYVFRACDLVMEGTLDAIVTAPLNKEAMNLAGFHYPGHTELLADRTGAGEVHILLVAPQLRAIHVSAHVSLEEAIRRVKKARIERVIDLAQQACQKLGFSEPRIGVAGLNPHASEGGLFGEQEALELLPAIQSARERGLNVSDPQPGDTVFMRAVKGEFDIVIAMYHDQGHIPMKLLAFDVGVNVTMGIPIIRTSVDHGTAFEIVGTGKASETSLLSAMDVAIQMISPPVRKT